MKIYPMLAPMLLFAACASHPSDRTEAQKNYLTVEASTQEKSAKRADHASRAGALASRVRAIDSQIVNQRAVITHWKNMQEVPSAPAMIANARERLKQLNAEKADLMASQQAELEKIEKLNEE